MNTCTTGSMNDWAYVISPVDLSIDAKGQPQYGGWVIEFISLFGDRYLTEKIATKTESELIARKFCLRHPGGKINPVLNPIAGEHPVRLEHFPKFPTPTQRRRRDFFNRESRRWG